MNEISVQQLKRRLDLREDLQLVDVRDPHEYELCRLRHAVHIPLDQLPSSHGRIERTKPVVVYCHHGIRSAVAVAYLSDTHGFRNLYNLEGGIHAWAVEIDGSMLWY
jgi:adenylyltransferase/sulfurtransferase